MIGIGLEIETTPVAARLAGWTDGHTVSLRTEFSCRARGLAQPAVQVVVHRVDTGIVAFEPV